MQIYNNFQKEFSLSDKIVNNVMEFKKNDSVEEILSSYCRLIERHDVGIKFKGVDIINDPIQISQIMKQESNDIEESHLSLALMRFELEFKEEIENIELKLLIPRPILNYTFFKLRGIYYNTILQIIDKNVYSIRNGFILKTTKMPLPVFIKYNTTLETAIGEVFTYDSLVLKIFKVELNPFNLMFARFGVKGTFARLGLNDDDIVEFQYKLSNDEIESNEDYYIFRLSSMYFLGVRKEKMTDRVLIMLESIVNKRLSDVKFNDDAFHLKRLAGMVVASNAKEEKGLKILKSFESFADDITLKTIENDNGAGVKDSYDLVEWFMDNYSTLTRLNNLDMSNKRVRFFEYILYPLQNKFTDGVNRLLNNRKNTMETRKSMFNNIKPNFIIKTLLTNNLNSYNNIPNSNFDIFLGTKFSFKGPQSMSANTDSNISDYYRSIHDSYLGVLELSDNSNSDPGMQGTIIPNVNINMRNGTIKGIQDEI